MDIELLARLMREKALLEESGELEPTPKINRVNIELAKKQKLMKLEEMQKLYFNAGRWAGGSRDWTARKAFERIGGKIEAGRER
jgi:hypothetical protein